MRLAAPNSSSAPQRPQLESCFSAARKSASDAIAPCELPASCAEAKKVPASNSIALNPMIQVFMAPPLGEPGYTCSHPNRSGTIRNLWRSTFRPHHGSVTQGHVAVVAQATRSGSRFATLGVPHPEAKSHPAPADSEGVVPGIWLLPMVMS